MTKNGARTAPAVLRRLESAGAAAVAELASTFEDLQTVLRCCERLLSELTRADGEPPDDLVVEAVWTTALLSYGRCFSLGEAGASLREEDLAATGLKGDVSEWHKVLLQLRDHYADTRANPRERFSVGVAQDARGGATGVAITSARQPLVDELTVRQTGAIAFALSTLVNDRIAARQLTVYDEIKNASKDELDKLDLLDVAPPAGGQ